MRWTNSILLLAAVTFLAESGRAYDRVPVGTYLYASPEGRNEYTGGLVLRFAKPGDRLVVAWGRKNRKDRKLRDDTTEAERNLFKPFKAEVSDNGRVARFKNLPPDFYDLMVMDIKEMLLYEGIELNEKNDPALAVTGMAEVKQMMAKPEDLIVGGWEAFFEEKSFDRFETDGLMGGLFLQQYRRGVAYAESGAVIEGCIHSIDVVWLIKGKGETTDWQVRNRQQLYRDEMPKREFLRHLYLPDLQGIRVGTREKDLGLLELPAIPSAKKN